MIDEICGTCKFNFYDREEKDFIVTMRTAIHTVRQIIMMMGEKIGRKNR